MPQTVFVSATPADYEATHQSQVAEQVVRRPLLAETQVQIKVLTGYVVIIALLPLGWWLARIRRRPSTSL